MDEEFISITDGSAEEEPFLVYEFFVIEKYVELLKKTDKKKYKYLIKIFEWHIKNGF